MTWPTHPDGSNKTIGEMTAEERREQVAASRRRDDLRQMILAMVLAAIQADGKELADLTKEQMDEYCASATEDIRLSARLSN